MKKIALIILLGVNFIAQAQMQLLKIAADQRSFATADGKPFFWLGDTGWLLFKKCKKEDAIKYLDTRKAQGFNVIQVMLLHELDVTDAYGDAALRNKNVATPLTTGKSYGYWDNVDFVVKEAAKRGIYMAMVPVWGGNVKEGHVTEMQARIYATFLANRYKNTTNIIWLNGGDIKGSDSIKVWQTIGNTLRSIDKKHLIGFHPRGRNSSSQWFQNESWLDFNMFQSGHRSYAQDTSANETLHYGEDNWRYVNDDYNLKPTKPTFDGEPSYEDIPYGLHDGKEPYWQDYEIRRYAYWSVFAGGCGFTYGHNSVMQFYTPGDSGISYFPKITWQDGLVAPGARQMQWLKKLMLSKPFFDRSPAQDLVTSQGERYNYIAAMRVKNAALLYTYTGRNIDVDFAKYAGKKVKSSWYNPRTGKYIAAGKFNNDKRVQTFDPPGDEMQGNDWVLVLENSK